MASPPLTQPLIHLEKLPRVYASGSTDLIIIHDLNLEVTEGEQVAVMGKSGVWALETGCRIEK